MKLNLWYIFSYFSILLNGILFEDKNISGPMYLVFSLPPLPSGSALLWFGFQMIFHNMQSILRAYLFIHMYIRPLCVRPCMYENKYACFAREHKLNVPFSLKHATIATLLAI